MFSCEFYKISKNTFFTVHLLVTASEMINLEVRKRKLFAKLTIHIGRAIKSRSWSWILKSILLITVPHPYKHTTCIPRFNVEYTWYVSTYSCDNVICTWAGLCNLKPLYYLTILQQRSDIFYFLMLYLVLLVQYSCKRVI